MRLKPALVAMMLLLGPASALAGSVEDATAVVDRWAAAYSANDVSGVANLYTSDAILFGTARPIDVDASRPIIAQFASLPDSGNTVRICRRQGLIVGEDAVLVTGSYQFQTIDQEEVRETLPGRFTMLVVKRDGKWRISYHTSSRPDPELDSSLPRTGVMPQPPSAVSIAGGSKASFDGCR